MNLVKLTNRIALITVILMIYWVFTFVCTEVFGFKVFRKNMTEMFALSILGIFAVLGGALILNIMFNLTAIAEQRQNTPIKTSFNVKWGLTAFTTSLFVIFGALYAGDLATTKKRERYLLASAQSLVNEQKNIIKQLSNYEFSKPYINTLAKNVSLLSDIEEEFAEITVITSDNIDSNRVLLGFNQYQHYDEDKHLYKPHFIISTSKKERDFLYDFFDGKNNGHLFSSHNSNYELYYPIATEKGRIVLHLTKYNRYGKIGS